MRLSAAFPYLHEASHGMPYRAIAWRADRWPGTEREHAAESPLE
jgi:hypothetical protein